MSTVLNTNAFKQDKSHITARCDGAASVTYIVIARKCIRTREKLIHCDICGKSISPKHIMNTMSSANQ